MKKFLTALLLIFITAGMAFAASKDEVLKDLEMYNAEVNPKIVEALGKIENETVVIDNVIEKGAKNDIKTSMKIIDNQVAFILDHMQKYTAKIKTKEVKDYHNITIEYIKVRHAFLKDATDSFLKNGKITDEEKARITNKYAKSFEELDKKHAEILKTLTVVVHPGQNGTKQ